MTKASDSKRGDAAILAVIFADSHLGLKRCIADGFFSFSQIVDYAIDHHIPWILAAGDLLDKKINDSQPIVFLEQQLAKLEKAGVRLCYIQGQHECADSPWFSLRGHAIHQHRKVINLGVGGATVIYGLDYQSGECLKSELAEIRENAKVLMAHQVWADFMGDQCLPQGEFADVPENIELLITGDFHQMIWAPDGYRNKGGRKFHVFSPGATHQTKIDEPSDCFFGLLRSDLTVKPVKLRTRKFDEFHVKAPHELEEFLGNVEAFLEGAAEYAEDWKLPSELHAPYWRIHYSSQLSNVEARIAKVVQGGAKLFFKEHAATNETESKLLAPLPDIRAGEALTLRKCLTQVADPGEEPEIFELSRRLLDAADPAVELTKWKQEVLSE